MTDYYVDPAAEGENDGSSWTDAWTSLQTAADTVTAGNTVYCRGTETLSATIDFDTNSGDTSSNGYIKYIGCNSGGTNDGTQFILDGNSSATYCISLGVNYVYFENFQFKNATSHGVTGSTSYGMVFLNCTFNNNGGAGIYGYAIVYGSVLIRCLFYSNTTAGVLQFRGTSILFCCMRDNTTDGLDLSNSINSSVLHNLFFDNGDCGIESVGYNLIYGNVCDSNTSHGLRRSTGTYPYIAIGNRFTNQNSAGDSGINDQDRTGVSGWNYFEDNNTNLLNVTYSIELLNNGATTNEADQADTSEGYTSKSEGSEDYNLRSDATLRRTAIQIPTGQ